MDQQLKAFVLAKMWVLTQVSKLHKQSSITPVSEDMMPSSGLHRHCLHTVHRHT